ncbi:hypothetical protein [Sporichthya brevicatena]
MMQRLRPLLARHRHCDAGMSMILVIGYGTVLSLMLGLLTDRAIESMSDARRSTDYHAALAAAQAGVDDYVSRLNANNVYWQTVDCTNLAMRRPLGGTCGWGVNTAVGWSPVPGVRDPQGVLCSTVPTPLNCARYHYEADTSSTGTNGSITVVSTGKVRSETRTVRVVVQRKGFGDFLYYSDIESTDPANTYVYDGSPMSSAQAAVNCARYFWGTPARNSSCQDIQFITGDRINGPLHSNDAIMLQGNPVFAGTASTAWPNCAPSSNGKPKPVTSCYRANGTANPTFARSLTYLGMITLPPSNMSLRSQTVAATSVGAPGCLYTGPTRIKFEATGKMRVWSPYTLTGPAACGGNKPANVLVNVPANNVIYVQNLPATQTSPTASTFCSVKTLLALTTTSNPDNSVAKYSCRDGNAFVSGPLTGRVTIGADNNIYITDNLTYAGGHNGNDSLGLVANNSVLVWNPMSCNSCDTISELRAATNLYPTRPKSLKVEAAMLSLQHSFGVELYNMGAPLDNLQEYGSISQKYRGAVGTTGSGWRTGYLKDYNYDTRLRYAPPPFYLNPVQTAFGQATFAEIPALFS